MVELEKGFLRSLSQKLVKMYHVFVINRIKSKNKYTFFFTL